MSPESNNRYSNKIIRLTVLRNIDVILRRQSNNTHSYAASYNQMFKRQFAHVAYSLQL